MRSELHLMRIALTGLALIAAALWYSLSLNPEITPPAPLATEEYLKHHASKSEAEVKMPPSKTVSRVESDTASILLIGDSMGDGLRIPLAEYAKSYHYKFRAIAQPSSTMLSWLGSDTSGRLRRTLRDIRPTYLIMCIGSNELYTKDLKSYEQHLENLLAQIGDMPFVWVGPPKWNGDNGLTALIAEKIGEDRYFNSDARLRIPRAGDGIHPTFNGYFMWAEAVGEWLYTEARVPLMLRKPERKQPTKSDSLAQ